MQQEYVKIKLPPLAEKGETEGTAEVSSKYWKNH
jgi:hypothetical protein